jgi:TonB family protein
VRITYAELLAVGSQHNTAEYSLVFGPTSTSTQPSQLGPYSVEISVENADGTSAQISLSGVTLEEQLAGGSSSLSVIPLSSDRVRSFHIESARDSSGVVFCSTDDLSAAISFDDGAQSRWPLKTAGEIDIADGRLVSRANPQYPQMAQNQNVQGLVKVQVVINADGSLGGESIFQSSGSDLLDQAALDAARGSTFAPARLKDSFGGSAIRMAYIIDYHFTLS